MTRAKSPTHKVRFRRRREGKTDYSKRFAMVKSGLPRMVVRKSNKNVTIQFVEFDPKGDRILLTVNGEQLKKKFGWPSKRNSWTAYLAGLYAGRLASEKGVESFIFDMGRYTATKGNMLFAALKGAVDAGLKSDFDEEMVPSDKLSSPPEDIKNAFEEAKRNIGI